MQSDMKAPWMERLILTFGRQDSRIRSVLRIADSDSPRPKDRMRLLAVALRDRDASVREQAVRLVEPFARYLQRGTALLAGATLTTSELFDGIESEMRAAGVEERLIACLGDDNWHIRRDAAEALGQIRSRVATAPLLKALESDPDWHVREQAAGALGRIRDKRAVEPLATALGHDVEGAVRLYCARALGDLGDIAASAALQSASQDARADVRKAAAFALSSLQASSS